MSRTPRSLLVVAAFALAACNAENSLGGAPGASPNGPASGAEQLLKLIANEPGGISMAAAFSGMITRVGDCFGLNGDTTSWPYGTKVLPGNRIEVYGRAYSLGDRIEIGGGVFEVPHDLDPAKVERPDGCPMTDQFYVLANNE